MKQSQEIEKLKQEKKYLEETLLREGLKKLER